MQGKPTFNADAEKALADIVCNETDIPLRIRAAKTVTEYRDQNDELVVTAISAPRSPSDPLRTLRIPCAGD